MEQIEAEQVTEAVTGEVISPNQRQHLFKSATAMADFVDTFGIKQWQARSGYTAMGDFCIELTYLVNEE